VLSPEEATKLELKARQPFVPRADLFVRFAQEVLRAAAYDEEVWAKLFGGLQTIEEIRQEHMGIQESAQRADESREKPREVKEEEKEATGASSQQQHHQRLLQAKPEPNRSHV